MLSVLHWGVGVGVNRVWAGGVVGRVESQQITLSPRQAVLLKKSSTVIDTVQCMNVCCSTTKNCCNVYIKMVVMFAAVLFRLLQCLLQHSSDS